MLLPRLAEYITSTILDLPTITSELSEVMLACLESHYLGYDLLDLLIDYEACINQEDLITTYLLLESLDKHTAKVMEPWPYARDTITDIEVIHMRAIIKIRKY